jgi:putative DNA primase/helicase
MLRSSGQSSLDREGRLLVERLGGRWTSNGGVCRCPAHDDRSPSLSVRPGRTRLLLHCFAGCDAAVILRALTRSRLLEPGAPVAGAGTGRGSREACLQASAIRLWGASRPPAGTLAGAYLDARGLRSDSPELRFHPRTPKGAKPLTRYRPALIAAVRDDSGLLAVHRTFLATGAAAGPVRARAKCGLGRFGRGAVRLGGIGPRLGLAEGIETALSASALFGVPCWAALGTERFGLVDVPACVTRLLLFLDNDAGGRRAEALACAANPAVAIEVHYPPRSGEDWNDVLMASAERCGRLERGGRG